MTLHSFLRFRLLAAAACGILAGTVSAEPATTSAPLRIMTYNIHGGVPMGFAAPDYLVTEKDLDNLADVITSSGADIVALQEVKNRFRHANSKASKAPGYNQARELARRTGMQYVFASNINDTEEGRTANTSYMEWGDPDSASKSDTEFGEFGNAILTKLRIMREPQNIPLPNIEGKEQRSALRAELEGGIVLFATHLQHDDAGVRVRQMRALVDVASRENAPLVLIAGDLNYAPGAKGNLLQMAERNGFVDLAADRNGGTATCPADKPMVRIDYVLAKGNVAVTSASVLETTASDHRPQLVTIERRAKK